jgi:hypothetical protein
MGLRSEIVQLMRTGDVTGLERLAAADRRVMRHLIGRLWDPDESIRESAARGVGAAAVAHRDLGLDVLRRLLWALNDESATNGAYAVAAIGEIGSRDPELVEPFVGPLASYAWDDGLRGEILKALARIAEGSPRLVAPHLERLGRHIDDDNQGETELAATLWSLTKENHEQA